MNKPTLTAQDKYICKQAINAIWRAYDMPWKVEVDVISTINSALKTLYSANMIDLLYKTNPFLAMIPKKDK